MKHIIKLSIFILLGIIVIAGYGGMCGLLNKKDDSSGSSAPRQISLTSDSSYKCVGNSETATYNVTVHNDSDHTRPVKITGTPAAANWVVTYYDVMSGTNITSQIISDGFLTPAITSTYSYTVQFEVTPVSVTPGSFVDTFVNASYTDNPQIKDDTSTRTQGVSKPILTSSIPLSGTAVFVLGNYAYTTGEDYLKIIDVSNPASPTLVSSYAIGTWSHGEVYVSGNYAYVSDGGGEGKLEIIDVSNPASPTFVGSYPLDNCRLVYVSGNYAYVSDGLLNILDVSNPASPTLAGTYDMRFNMGVSSFCVSGNYAYVSGRPLGAHDNLEIIDISNPASPTFVGSYCGTITSKIHVSGNYVYLVDDYSGLKIVDISNPVAPTLVGSYDAPAYRYSHNWTDFMANVFVSGDYAYIRAGSSTSIINISDPSHPTFAGSWSPNVDIHVSGDYAYMLTWGSYWASLLASDWGTEMDPNWGTDWDAGLQIIKLTD